MQLGSRSFEGWLGGGFQPFQNIFTSETAEDEAIFDGQIVQSGVVLRLMAEILLTS